MTLIVFQLTAEPPFKNVNKFQFGSTFWPEKASFSNPIENREKCNKKPSSAPLIYCEVLYRIKTSVHQIKTVSHLMKTVLQRIIVECLTL